RAAMDRGDRKRERLGSRFHMTLASPDGIILVASRTVSKPHGSLRKQHSAMSPEAELVTRHFSRFDKKPPSSLVSNGDGMTPADLQVLERQLQDANSFPEVWSLYVRARSESLSATAYADACISRINARHHTQWV